MASLYTTIHEVNNEGTIEMFIELDDAGRAMKSIINTERISIITHTKNGEALILCDGGVSLKAVATYDQLKSMICGQFFDQAAIDAAYRRGVADGENNHRQALRARSPIGGPG